MNNTLNDLKNASIDRRTVLAAGGVLMAASAAGPALAADAMDHSHGHGGAKKYQGVVDTTLHCVKMGQFCLEHCLVMFKKGDVSLADCTFAVEQMLAMCSAMSKLAALDSPYAASLAMVCMDVCAACEKECRKHADVHPDCKNCAESCAACIAECKKIAA